MKHVTMIILGLIIAFQSVYGDAIAEFKTRTTQLLSLINEQYPETKITRSEKTFEAEFDTMIYTVHRGGPNYKTTNPNYSEKTVQRKGPRAHGFIVKISLLPDPNTPPQTMFNRGIRQTPYWEEYYWWGCHDTKQYIRLDIKFGHQVSETFKAEIIKILCQLPQGMEFDPLKKLKEMGN